ncbi:N-acetyltransferase [Spirochaetia bacterium]|nr:N-acetyltransferase [Spirochaetia bacterium]GHU33139.1 N-acetyltransferase [Spirochaetia bacterium]
MYFKKIIGNKCFLSPMDINDAEKITEWLNDLEITLNLNLYSKNVNNENEIEILKNVSKDHYYSIIDKNKNEIIGCCSFKSIDHLNQTAEIGIYIGNKNYWNKGYGSEALTLLLDYGFKALNLHNVLLNAFEYNIGAIKCYKKVGFNIIGKRREALKRERKTHNIIYMDILEKEFYENNKILKEIRK